MKFPTQPYRAAQLGVTDIACLHGVSRPTANRWLNTTGGGSVHSMAREQVRRLAAAVAAANAAGLLPVPKALRGAERAAAIRAATEGRARVDCHR